MADKWKKVLGMLAVIAAAIWSAALLAPGENFRLIACDVGQGDAILAVYKNKQILIDGGPDKSVLDCLGRHIPFWDRKIEVVVLTHPQKDHLGGLIEVFERYEVEYFLANALNSSSQEYKVLKNRVGGSGAKVVNATSGNVIRLGMIHLDIVHPSNAFLASSGSWNEGYGDSGVLGAYTSRKDPNEFSIVAIISYGQFDALLTGDIQPPITDMISDKIEERENISLEYIKIPHHGSKNGLTEKLLSVAKPEIAVISVGKNSWGHPNKETLELLERRSVEILRTDEMGDVVVETDGESVWF
ncbi:MAG: MBL fold metallo-hydrolase [Candidatus Woesebacteria bacterium]|jgi:competence protein ComEC